MASLVRSVLVSMAAGLSLAVTSQVMAAEPPNGTLTTSSAPITYTAGPFFVANVSPQLGLAGQPPVCEADGQSCDEFELTVTLPDNYDVTNPNDLIEVSVAWPDPAADFDMYVYNAAGVTVASSAGSGDPEVARFIAGKGTQTYTVQVIPFAPLGESIEGTITLKAGTGGGGSGPAPLPPAARGLPPRFLTDSSPPGLADGGDEPLHDRRGG